MYSGDSLHDRRPPASTADPLLNKEHQDGLRSQVDSGHSTNRRPLYRSGISEPISMYVLPRYDRGGKRWPGKYVTAPRVRLHDVCTACSDPREWYMFFASHTYVSVNLPFGACSKAGFQASGLLPIARDNYNIMEGIVVIVYNRKCA